MIQRFIKKIVEKKLFKGKVVIIYGPRQSGKTTLVKSIIHDFENNNKQKKVRYYSCDDKVVREALVYEDYDSLQKSIGNYDLVILDEAQRIENIGLKLKLLVDNNTSMQIIATGSASFDLANKIKEPLTGRFYEFELLPFSVLEVVGKAFGDIDMKKEFDRSSIYGLYPDIYNRSFEESKELLNSLSSSYLYKDILELEHIKKSESLEKIVTMLALQLGNEVNLNEVARVVKLNIRTVEKYINLLEKAYVIFRLRAYTKNERNEVSRNFKVYFYDLGIRNSIIKNFSNLENRSDTGGIFENWCILERLKNYYNQGDVGMRKYFWRDYQKREIDYLEERDGALYAFEFKYTKERSKNYTKLQEITGVQNIKIINKENLSDLFT